MKKKSDIFSNISALYFHNPDIDKKSNLSVRTQLINSDRVVSC